MSCRYLLRLVYIVLTVIFCISCRQSPTPTYHIGVSQCSDDAWRQKMDEEIRRELLFHPQMQLSIRSAGDNSALQSLQIDSFIQERVDLLIVSPNEADGLTDAVSRAYDAGIPVIVADRRVHGDKYTAFIGGDNYQVGKLLAEHIEEHLPSGGTFVLLRGLEGSTPDVYRYAGLTDHLPDNITIADELHPDWFKSNAKQLMAQYLLTHTPELILAFNDPMAIGAWEACDEWRRRQSEEGRETGIPIIIGVDALHGDGGGVEAIVSGKLDASVSYATAGDLIVRRAVQILAGEPFQRDTVIPAMLVDKDAAEPMMALSHEIDNDVQTITLLHHHIDLYSKELRQERTIFALVGLITLLAIFFFIYYLHQYRQRKRLSEQLMVAKEDLERATLSKLTFFTNVSHDFRTPLTLIADPITQLAEDKTLSKEQHTLARLAQKNAMVLLRLINQTLDLRKFESGMLRLNLSRIDLSEALAEWIEAFQPLAQKRHIHLMLNIERDVQTSFVTALDVEKTERIVYNLIANAFKFTPQNGEIKVNLKRVNDDIVFCVCDTGCGIPAEHKRYIFDSFYQVDTTNRQGSGIGLTLVRSFVNLQGGNITLRDNVPTGTCFTVTLPVNNTEDIPFTFDGGFISITPELILAELDEISSSPDDFSLTSTDILSINDSVLLCIDDNPDIRHYIRHLFQKDFTVITARNGEEGLRKAASAIPDIIICDISMPDLDGLQVTQRLKTSTATSHIPILLLTAHSLDEKKAEGLDIGADAYMIKPFNALVLKAQVKTLIDNRRRVRDSLSQQVNITTHNPAEKEHRSLSGDVEKYSGQNTPTQVTTTMEANRPAARRTRTSLTAEEKFLQQFGNIVSQNLSNENLSVETIAQEMAMSRTQLYRKIKQITNFSPNELVRKLRLEQAQLMLLKGGLTVAEVAYSTGFSSPSYFTKCYSDYFGHNPTQV